MRFINKRTGAVVAGAAVIGLLGGAGGATADSLIGSPDIKNQSIESHDIGANEVGSSEIRPNALRKHQIAKNSVGWFGELNQYTRDKITSLAGQDGEDGTDGASAYQLSGFDGTKEEWLASLHGEDGEDGEDGTDGTDGTDGVNGYEVAGVEVTVPVGENFSHTQKCPEGKVALGGGFKLSGGNAGEITVDHSMPGNLVETDSGEWVATGWTVQVDNNSTRSGTEQVVAYVVCSTVS